MEQVEPATQLFEDGYFDDSHKVHARLRREGCPVRPAELPGKVRVWAIGGYDNVLKALMDGALSKDHRLVQAAITARTIEAGLPAPDAFSRMLGNHMLFLEGPEHSKQRNAVKAQFTARRVEELRPRIERITSDLLDELAAEGDAVVDLVDRLAGVVPLAVICELLGIPDVDRARFRTLSVRLMDDDRSETAPASAELEEFFRNLIAGKRRRREGDLTSALLGDFDDDMLINLLFLLFIAGHETSVNLIGNTLLVLLERPELWRAVHADPTLVGGVVEEALRSESPVRHATHRVTVKPVVYGERTIPAGELVLPSLASANRDPARFPRPDEFDPHRDTLGHVAFGYGSHYCLGAPLGRAEAEIVVRQFTGRFPEARLEVPVRELRRIRSAIMHGLAALPVRLRSH